jgi:4-hydroxy-4-methyl-2-oxoglutarate aldolase
MITLGTRSAPALDPAHLQALGSLASATLSDVLGPSHVVMLPVAPLRADWRVVGPALTVQLPPGDNLGMHVAVREARPGDVLLVQQGAQSRGSPVGEIMALAAQAQGAAGIVLDGPVRDTATLRRGSLPVFASARCAQACTKTGPAWINVPISIGGVWVRPGDVVVGDEDGVVVVPFERVAEAIEAARAHVDKERRRIAAIADGAVSPEWLERSVQAVGLHRL